MYRGERFNSYSHLLGAAFSVPGLVVLLVSATRGDAWKTVSFSIYGAGLILLYAVSTLYHAIRGPAKALLQRLDHLAIYLLIAATYTPFTLVTLRGPWGWSLFGVTWGLALLGMVQEWCLGTRTRIASLVIYLTMGWLGVLALRPLAQALSPPGLAWLLAGGGAYTGGLAFYFLDTRWKTAHGIWHLCVLTGSVSHYWCLLRYVA